MKIRLIGFTWLKVHRLLGCCEAVAKIEIMTGWWLFKKQRIVEVRGDYSYWKDATTGKLLAVDLNRWMDGQAQLKHWEMLDLEAENRNRLKRVIAG
jgi:hypothetical protein